MRTESEIRRALALFDTLNAEDAAVGVPIEDPFQLGQFTAKQLALGWVLGETPSSLLTSHFTLADWQRERREQRFHEKPPAVED